MRCVVKNCQVESGGYIPFSGEFCQPCYDFITQGVNNYSTAYRNSAIPQFKAILTYFENFVKRFYSSQIGWLPEDEVEATYYLAQVRANADDQKARTWLREHQRIN